MAHKKSFLILSGTKVLKLCVSFDGFFFILRHSLDINKEFLIGNLRLCLSFHSRDFLGKGNKFIMQGQAPFHFIIHWNAFNTPQTRITLTLI